MSISKKEFMERMFEVSPEQVAAKLGELFAEVGRQGRRIAELEAQMSELRERAGVTPVDEAYERLRAEEFEGVGV